MAGDDNLTINERRKCLKRIRKRYAAADRCGHGRLLDEMEVYTGMHRKGLIRLLGAASEYLRAVVGNEWGRYSTRRLEPEDRGLVDGDAHACGARSMFAPTTNSAP